jgi:hypothetical protein
MAGEEGRSHVQHTTHSLPQAFDSALKDVTRTVLRTVGCPEWWMRAKEHLWRDMNAKLWLDGEEVGRVEWANGVLQGGCASPADYAAFTIYVRQRVADEFREQPIVQAWVADDSLFLVDPKQAEHLASFLVQEYHDLFMEIRADKTEASMLPAADVRVPATIKVPIRHRVRPGPPVARPMPPQGKEGAPQCPKCERRVCKLMKEGMCRACRDNVEDVEVRQDILKYMGGHIELAGQAEMPDKVSKKCKKVIDLWQAYPGLRLRDVLMQWNAVVAGSLRTQQAAALLDPRVTDALQAQGREHVIKRTGFTLAQSTPHDYLYAQPPYGLGMVELALDGAKTHLLSIMSLNHAPEESFNTVDREIGAALRELGLCQRIVVPQDGKWMDDKRFHGSLISHTLEALRRLDTVLVREHGKCFSRGPLLVQRTAKQGAGIPHAPGDNERDGVRIIQPRDTSGQGTAWLELWKVAGREIPMVPVWGVCASTVVIIFFWFLQENRAS